MNHTASPTSLPPAGAPHRPLLSLLACAAFLIASLLVTAFGRGERSGWILMTSPTGYDHRANTMLGYCFLHGSEPFMKENIPSVAQVGLFSGSLEAFRSSEFREDFRLLRALYGFLGAVLEPVFGAIGSMLFLNWLAWALCAWIAWRLTGDLFGNSLASLIAVLLVSGGIGMTAHIGDYSPHLLAFAGYYLGVWLIYRSGVHRESCPLGIHLALGAFFAIVGLAYNTGVMLVGVYLLCALWHNRWAHMTVAAVLGLSARPLWQMLLGARVVDVEAEYLQRALAAWRELLGGDPVHALRMIARWISELVLFFDSPVVVVIGLACLLLTPLPRSTRWLGLCAVCIPFLAALVFAPSATARGYIVYGSTVWIYPLLAVQLARGLRARRASLRTAAVLGTSLMLLTHYWWATAHLFYELGPLKTYFLGWYQGIAYVTSPATDAVSLTGREPTPILFGGRSTLAEAGAFLAPTQRELRGDQVSIVITILTRLWFVGWVGLAILFAARNARRRALLPAGLAVGLLLSAVVSWLTFRSIPAFLNVDRAAVVPAGGSLRYEVELSSEFLAALRQRASGDATLALFVCSRAKAPVDVRFFAGSTPLPARTVGDQVVYSIADEERSAVLKALADAKQLTLVLSNSESVEAPFAGWQKGELSGRKCVISGPDARESATTEVLPALEIRVLRPNGRIDLVGF